MAIAFAEGDGTRDVVCLYAFAMPDLRGSITSDIDQHLTLARLEAICPPDAKRPHHQDAYLAARFPEPADAGGADSEDWNDWENKNDAMRRLVAKFQLELTDGRLSGAPQIDKDFLIPLARGGMDAPSNMQWLTRQANRRKGDMRCSRR